jgi:hypothetical protein
MPRTNAPACEPAWSRGRRTGRSEASAHPRQPAPPCSENRSPSRYSTAFESVRPQTYAVGSLAAASRMSTQDDLRLSSSEKLALRHIADGELHPRELDWLALQRRRQAGLLQIRPLGRQDEHGPVSRQASNAGRWLHRITTRLRPGRSLFAPDWAASAPLLFKALSCEIWTRLASNLYGRH